MVNSSSGVPLQGIFPASLTMFHRSGRIDLPRTASHLQQLVDEGADGIVVGGTSGEFIALDDAERRSLAETAMQAVGHKVPVIVGTGSFSTQATVSLTRHAQRIGAAAAIVILPYYQRPTAAEIRWHYREVARSTDIPVMAYNNPTNSAAPAMSAADLAALYAEGVIAGVKSTFPTVHQVHEARAMTDDGFRVFYGSFMAPLEGLAGGAHGWISGILNVVLPQARRMFSCVERGDLDGARAAWAEILPYKSLYTSGRFGDTGDLSIWRAVLDLRGQHGGYSRRPLAPLAARDRRALGGLLGIR